MINEVVEAISDPFICLDQDRRIVCTNRAARDLFGDDLGPEGLCGTLGAAVDPALGRARRTSGQLPFSVEVPDADGVPKRHSGLVRRVGGAQLKGFALRLHDQESNRFGLLTRQIDRLKQEVRARKAAQEKAEAAAAAQRASEARFRALIEATAQTVWTTDASGSITEDSPSWRSFTGQSIDEWLGDGWINAVHPDDRQPTMANWRLAVAERRAVEVDYRVRRSDGEWRWMTARSVPVFEEDGTLAGYVGMNSDITERKLDEEHRELLIRELNHRVKNSLAVIQAMALQTIRHTKDLDEFKKAYIGRLNAMASSHDLLVNGEDRGVRLDGLIRRQLAPHICNPAQLSIKSRTRVDIDADTAHSLGLVLHELATNAVKYGALSRSDGVIEIAWRTSRETGEEMATLTWRERNGPAISTPSRKGFGTTLIETTLSHTLGGSGEIRYEPEGVVASLSFPVGGSDG